MINQSLHIVIVDDDRLQVAALQKIITDTNLAAGISVFGNGQEAVDYLANLSQQGDSLPHVIFLDINMPVMNAWRFLELFTRMKRLLYRPIPIYVVTGSTEGTDMAQSRHHAAVRGYITKPVSKEKIRQVLESLEAE